jgi:hypothetical protein
MYQPDAHTDGKSQPTRSAEPIRNDRVEEARQKVAAGDYDRPEIISAVVDRIITCITGN